MILMDLRIGLSKKGTAWWRFCNFSWNERKTVERIRTVETRRLVYIYLHCHRSTIQFWRIGQVRWFLNQLSMQLKWKTCLHTEKLDIVHHLQNPPSKWHSSDVFPRLLQFKRGRSFSKSSALALVCLLTMPWIHSIFPTTIDCCAW